VRTCAGVATGKLRGLRLPIAPTHSTIGAGCILVAIMCCIPASPARADADAPRDAPVAKRVFAFYYPWYGRPGGASGAKRWVHWEDVDADKRTIGSSTHYPTLGPYDSHDEQIITQHAKWSKQAKLDGWIVSWWGHDTFEDRAMPRLLDLAAKHQLTIAAYHERVPEPIGVDSFVADVERLIDRYGKHPAYLKLGGRPVVFVYIRTIEQLGPAGVREAGKRLADRAALIGDVLGRGKWRETSSAFAGLYAYNTAGRLRNATAHQADAVAADQYRPWVALARAHHAVATLTVIPGYDDTKIRTPGLVAPRHDGALYRAQWRRAIEARPDWILITSFNEWHEGSDIEPSVEHGEKYLNLTAEMVEQFKADARTHAPSR